MVMKMPIRESREISCPSNCPGDGGGITQGQLPKDVVKAAGWAGGSRVPPPEAPAAGTWKVVSWWMSALRIVWIWDEMTESTDASMRLNSSKQPQAPVWAKPL